jgi:hypothetical protein
MKLVYKGEGLTVKDRILSVIFQDPDDIIIIPENGAAYKMPLKSLVALMDEGGRDC